MADLIEHNKCGNTHHTTVCDCDTDSTKRRQVREEDWRAVVERMFEGGGGFGSATPYGDPRWVTPVVLSGGFAAHRHAAALDKTSTDPRARNEYWVTAEGMGELSAMLDSGRYTLEHAENGVLLSVAWLMRQGRREDAAGILREIKPYMDKLAFFPTATETRLELSSETSVETVGGLLGTFEDRLRLSACAASKRFQRETAMRDAITVWLPIKWKLVALFLETIECEHVPDFARVSNGHLLRDSASGQPVHTTHPECPRHQGKRGCGWMLQTFPEGWLERAAALLAEIEAADAAAAEVPTPRHYGYTISKRTPPSVNGRVHGAKSSTALMIKVLTKCVREGPDSLGGLEVGNLRKIVAGLQARHGLPGSTEHDAWLAVVHAGLPKEKQYLKDIVKRLRMLNQNTGCDAATIEMLKEGMPPSVRSALDRLRIDTVGNLMDAGIITSGETLATAIWPLVSHAEAMAYDDPALRRLVYTSKKAFASRRSLLLTDLESQTRIDDLPWLRVLLATPVATDGTTRCNIAENILQEVVMQYVRHFPQTMFPNKPVQAFADLLKMADIDMMPVNEIASDIFEGRFSAKFAKSAEEAYSVIPVLYKRYFGMHTPEVCETLEDGCTTEAFTDLCYTMSGVKKPSWRMYMPPSEAGMVIEQMSILTTHNLYPLLLLAGFPFYQFDQRKACLLYTSPSPRDLSTSRMPSSA